MSNEQVFSLDSDEVDLFLQEVNGHLQAIEAGILSLEHVVDPEILNSTFRAAHTLKAVAATVGHRPMAELTHGMETLLDAVRQGRLTLAVGVSDELLTIVDVLRALRDQVVQPGAPAVDVAPWLIRLGELLRAPAAPPESLLQPAQPSLSPEQAHMAEEYRKQGLSLLYVYAVADPASFSPAARLLQVAQATATSGTILVQQPSTNELLRDQHQGFIGMVVAASPDLQHLEQLVRQVDEIAVVQVQPWAQLPPAGSAPVGTTAAVAPAAEIHPALEMDKTVQIHVDRLDALLDLVGEMVTDRTRLLQVEETMRARYGKAEQITALRDIVSHLGKMIDQLQEEVMQARMMPISSIWDKFPRLVRDAARAAGKQVNLDLRGEATELDRSILAAINDPLIHLLRNAVDHGIETPEVRALSGKTPAGTILLTAEHQEGQVIITIRDDGQGINPERTRRAAVRHGLLSEEEAAHLGDEESIALIFRPGLSTSERVTETSGRGVGLDVVRTNVSRIGGSVAVETDQGQGTTFRISLPLTLAIMQTMLVALGDDVYAIPMTSIVESMYVDDVQVNTVKGSRAIRWRDTILPLLALNSFFANPYRQEAHGKAAIIAVAWGKLQAGLVVDRIIGKQEIVVKPFGSIIGTAPGLSGCTIMGNGRIALIVDVPGLINAAIQGQR